MSQGTISREDLLWLLGSLCGLYRIPFDAALVEQQFPPPHTLVTLHEAARSLGVKTGSRSLAKVEWQSVPLPVIAFLRPGPTDNIPERAPNVAVAANNSAPIPGCAAHADIRSSDGQAPEGPPQTQAVLILKSDGGNLLFFRPGCQSPETISIEEASAKFDGEILMVAKEPVTGSNKDEEIPGFVAEKKEFGFYWFLPELLKHKKIWHDIVLASLAIQLVGLVTPLFTQVIIDKVVVHQTKSTLIVLGVALVMFMVFTSAMTWLRQYLVLHTGNRIDAVLGSQVFRHLLRLPLPYFEQRPTGTLVARLHGVETIREFISGAAVTLILDLPFLLIFLGKV